MANEVAGNSDRESDREYGTSALPATDSARGASAAFDELVAAHYHRINRLVCRMLGWSHDGEDVVQEVFLSALKGIKKFRGQSSVSTWLTRIAVNKCRSHRRRLRVQLGLLRRAAERARRTHQAVANVSSIDRETFDRVRRAVRALPARYREVVVLRYLEETPTDEVAEVLGISCAAVGVRLHRARQRLKDMLGDLIEE